ncbi:MAG TPA: GGDEF domain-containing protein [Candidatus Deferrimicrobium sp.]|nr:GGDEF domain-containing protein [Candidatus Deferrimicrobium sp.]
MKRLIIRFFPFLVVAINLTIWVCAYLLDKFTNLPEEVVWLPFAFIQGLVGFTFGVLVKRLHKGVYQDELTGLKNRRYFFSKLKEEIERVNRTKSPVSLVLIDVDDFKLVNDRYGHTEGDKVLISLAKILKQHSRTIDTPARWGGEEFAIILPETTKNGAMVFAERLRGTVEQYKFSCKITISVGVATSNSHVGINDFTMMADKALYQAKEQKNTIVAYEPRKPENTLKVMVG